MKRGKTRQRMFGTSKVLTHTAKSHPLDILFISENKVMDVIRKQELPLTCAGDLGAR